MLQVNKQTKWQNNIKYNVYQVYLKSFEKCHKIPMFEVNLAISVVSFTSSYFFYSSFTCHAHQEI